MKKPSAAAREEAKRAVARASVMAAALKRREDELEQLVREQSKYRALVVVRRERIGEYPTVSTNRFGNTPCCVGKAKQASATIYTN